MVSEDTDISGPGEHARQLSEEAANIRAAQAIGKSYHLNLLFDYLLERSIAESQPKENEIAMDVFGKSAGTDLGQDASVRVNVHRLRKKLQEYYHQIGRTAGLQMMIPKGEYRLQMVDLAGPLPIVEEEPAVAPRRRWLVPALIAAAVALLAGGTVLRLQADAGLPPIAEQSPWRDIGQRSSRVILTVSDFPLPQAGRVAVPLSADSADRRQSISGAPSRYLPIGAAMSLNATLPVVSSLIVAPKTLNVIPISQLTPGMIVNSDIVYIGYIGGLDILRDIVFAQSRFMPGASDEELIDRRTGKHYRADPLSPDDDRMTRRDYSLIMSFPGPKGGRLIILAGTSDTGMIQASETGTDPAALAALLAKLPATGRFEALYEVETIGNRNVHARLLTASELPEFSWDIEARQQGKQR